MFVGRSALMVLVDQCVRVSGGAQVPEGVERPVLIVAGGGGSGRSQLLRQLWTEWRQKTPTVWVDNGPSTTLTRTRCGKTDRLPR